MSEFNTNFVMHVVRDCFNVDLSVARMKKKLSYH